MKFFPVSPLRGPIMAAALTVFGSMAQAATLTSVYEGSLTDNYWGGTNTYNNNTPQGDVIQSPSENTFQVYGISASRTTVTNTTTNVTTSSLTIAINTNFAGVPGTSAAAGTTYGSLFFAPTWKLDGAAGAPYKNDVYQANQWTQAFVLTPNPGTGYAGGTGTQGKGGLYDIGTVTNANVYPGQPSGQTIARTYTTTNGTIVMSNVNGNPISYPSNPNPGYYFRQGQAVQYVPNDPSATAAGTPAPTAGGASIWTVDEVNHLLTLSINDNGILGNGFALAWAMTCGNDVIQGMISLALTSPPQEIIGPPVPAPGAFILMGTALFGGAALLRRRKKRHGQAAQS